MTKPVGPKVDGFSRYRIDLGYDGTDFFGFAAQPGLRTVQSELTKAIEVIFGRDKNGFKMIVAGRTDAGVHAKHQVVHVNIPTASLGRIGRNPDVAGRLNTALPKDIRVYDFAVAPDGFNARYSAKYRRYRYRIADKSSWLNPLEARYITYLKVDLDLKRMRQAAKVMIGLHDFAAFCKPRAGATTIRRMHSIRIKRSAAPENLVEIELKADAFCHNMVRSLVGALVAVGRGRAEVSDVVSRLKSGSRAGSFKVVSGQGLTLLEVSYPAPSMMGKQAKRARNIRILGEN
jgi:tRNA pseudouridine38-40 synthase